MLDFKLLTENNPLYHRIIKGNLSVKLIDLWLFGFFGKKKCNS